LCGKKPSDKLTMDGSWFASSRTFFEGHIFLSSISDILKKTHFPVTCTALLRRLQPVSRVLRSTGSGNIILCTIPRRRPPLRTEEVVTVTEG